MSARAKQLLSLAVSLLLLAALYWSLDLRGLGRVFAQAHPGLLAVSVLAIFPIKLLQAWRLKRLVPRSAAFPYRFALRLIFLADVMNLVLPSKTGDLAKAWFMKGRGELSGSLAFSLVVFEKACDVLALLAWCAVGLLWMPEKGQPLELLTWGVLGALAAGLLALGSRGFAHLLFAFTRLLLPKRFEERAARLTAAWQEVRDHFRTQPRRAAEIAALSLFLWWVQFQQVWLFILAVRAWTPPLVNLALAPLAILAGLVPLTFAGLGTRDAALVALYSPWLAAPAAAAVGLLTSTRYFLPALAGFTSFIGAIEPYKREVSQMDAKNKPGSYTRRGFAEILAGVKLTRTWYERVVGYQTAATVLEEIETNLEGMVRDLASLEPISFLRLWDNRSTYYSLTEGSIFAQIHRQFSRMPSHQLPREALRKALNAPLCPQEEDPNTNEARNRRLELEIAAELLSNDIPISGYDDVKFTFEGVEFLIQCKRPFGESSIRANLQKAWEQTKDRIEPRGQTRGLIFISLARVHEVESPYAFQIGSERDIERFVRTKSHEFSEQHGPFWVDLFDERVAAIILGFKFIAHTLPPENTISLVDYRAVIPMVPPNSDEFARLRRMAAVLRSPGD